MNELTTRLYELAEQHGNAGYVSKAAGFAYAAGLAEAYEDDGYVLVKKGEVPPWMKVFREGRLRNGQDIDDSGELVLYQYESQTLYAMKDPT